jgi:hypothetical protein
VGSDDLFHKRRERKTASLRRGKAKFSPYDIVLIVCEGDKTEPNYFAGLKDAFRLNNANVRICGKECGSDPLSVVNFAIDTMKQEPMFDRAYCVFDQDNHATYAAALDKVQRARLGEKRAITVIPSIPCFEFWLLLHFTYTSRQFHAHKGVSICGSVEHELRRHLPNYHKGQFDIFAAVSDKLDLAIAHAKQLDEFHKTSGNDNPSTKIHLLIEYLRDLKK